MLVFVQSKAKYLEVFYSHRFFSEPYLLLMGILIENCFSGTASGLEFSEWNSQNIFILVAVYSFCMQEYIITNLEYEIVPYLRVSNS